MRKEKRNFTKLLIALLVSFSLIFGICVSASAEEREGLNVGDVLPDDMAPDYEGGNDEADKGENSTESGEGTTDSDENDMIADTPDGGKNDTNADTPDGGKTDANADTPDGGKNDTNADGSVTSDIQSYEKNLFEEFYRAIEANADKILAGLAFIGTLIVGLAYKSGLMPLLRDALSKLKSAIDKLSESSELAKVSADTDLSHIKGELVSISNSLEEMKWQYESYDSLLKEREKNKRIMLEQIDMLYAIFMSSALPQYQKEEVGEKIKKMREELSFYESTDEI